MSVLNVLLCVAVLPNNFQTRDVMCDIISDIFFHVLIEINWNYPSTFIVLIERKYRIKFELIRT